jgi:hypothetical protein
MPTGSFAAGTDTHMSCYILPNDHIAYLVNLGAHLEIGGVVYDGRYKPLSFALAADRAFVTAELMATNRASAGYQPLAAGVCLATSCAVRLVELVDLVQALQWVRCYRYQSCEAPDWNTTFAYQYTNRLQTELVSRIIARFDTSWEYNGPELTKCA